MPGNGARALDSLWLVVTWFRLQREAVVDLNVGFVGKDLEYGFVYRLVSRNMSDALIRLISEKIG